MKTKFLTLVPFLVSFNLNAQEGVKEITKSEAENIENKVNKGVDFGISLGFNSVFRNIYDARISPLDNKLKITNIPKAAFLLSTGISVPISNGKLGGRYYRKLNNDGETIGPVYYVPYGFCFIATVNLISFSSAGTGSLFNQKIDGGLGIGYRINDNFQLSLTGEMISYRQPRSFLLNEFKDKELRLTNGDLITSISQDDNDYYQDKYMPAVSFKFFYLISYNPTRRTN